MKRIIVLNMLVILLLLLPLSVQNNRLAPVANVEAIALSQSEPQQKRVDVKYGSEKIEIRVTESEDSQPVTVAVLDASYGHPLFPDMLVLSPNGQFVAYVTSTNAYLIDADLWVAHTDGSGTSVIAHFDEGLYTVAPVWSPDSTQLAYVTKQVESAPDEGLELWTIGRDGLNTQLVIDGDFLKPAIFERTPHEILSWPSTNTIEFIDRWSKPAVRYTLDLSSGIVSQQETEYQENIAPSSGITTQAALPCTVPIYNQSNYTDNMRTCNQTIRAAGCALTSTAMVFRYFGVNTDPQALNSCLGNSACPIYWYTATGSCSERKVSVTGVHHAFSYTTIQSDLNAGKPVLVWMSKGSNGTHYVVVTSGSGTSPSGYTINDPADGSTNKTLQNYVNAGWSLRDLIRYSGTPSCSSAGTEGGQINYGETKSASINPAGNYDDWWFNANAGDIIEIRQNKNGSSLDSYVQLLDSSMNVITYDDDSGGDRNSYLRRTLSSGGRYTIRARGYNNSSTGAYTLNLTRQASAPACDGEGDPRNISFGQTLSGNLCNNSDSDTFYFSATSGRAIQIDMVKSTSGLDSYLDLYNSGGSKVAENDDGGGNANSRITYTVPSSGTYRVVARSYRSSSSGNYNLTVRAVASNSPTGNLARGKPVAVSSTEVSGYEGYRATDGNMGTRWSSRFSDPQWLYIDLGTNTYVNQVVLKWEAAYGRSFGIYAKSASACGNCWTNYYWTNSGRGGTNTISIPRGQYRYVMIYGSGRGTSWGYSLWEVELYDTSTLTMPEVLPDDPEKVPDDNSIAPLPLADPDKEILLHEFNGVLGQEELPLDEGSPAEVTLASELPHNVFAYIHSPDEGGLFTLSTDDGSILFDGEAQSSVGAEPVNIIAYSWRSNIDGQLSSAQTFTLMPTDLRPGLHTIYFKAQNEFGEWSLEDSVQLNVAWSNTIFVPMVKR